MYCHECQTLVYDMMAHSAILACPDVLMQIHTCAQGGTLGAGTYLFTVTASRSDAMSNATVALELATTAGTEAPAVSIGQLPSEVSPQLPAVVPATILEDVIGGCLAPRYKARDRPNAFSRISMALSTPRRCRQPLSSFVARARLERGAAATRSQSRSHDPLAIRSAVGGTSLADLAEFRQTASACTPRLLPRRHPCRCIAECVVHIQHFRTSSRSCGDSQFRQLPNDDDSPQSSSSARAATLQHRLVTT